MPRITKRRFLEASAAGAALGWMPELAVAQDHQAPLERDISGPWQFREAVAGEWLPATVPGTVHTDLLANKKIPDPFIRTNERDLQWIDKKDWEYRTILDLDAATLAERHIELCFAGLDTIAEVTLNDAPILQADNMFRRWTADIKPHAKAGANALRVLLRSPVREGLKRLAAVGYDLPAVDDWSEIGGLGDTHVSMMLRKAAYHYGWDWGPRFVTSGIWRKVSLRAWSGARIADLTIVQNHVSAEKAKLTARFEIVSDEAGPAMIVLASPTNPAVTARKRIVLKPGVNIADIHFTIAKPKLWWSNGLGEAFLYDFVGTLAGVHGGDRRTATTGLRTIRIVQKPDDRGTSFNVELNGVPVFMKGANYIPNDSFLPRVTRAKYERLVRSAADTHMNMIRVWGGGVYEGDVFYDLCDRHGILVWQEFAFACLMYPGDEKFLDNVREEAADNIRRLRNHPSIALWVGNNEIDAAWQNDVPEGGWGWKQQLNPAQRAQLWATYKTIFYHILPDAVAAHDPQRFYWPSSPLASWDGSDEVRHADLATPKQSGDIHYWGVWWGEKPFSSYRTNVGRFMSEYGFQSFPEFKTVQAYAAPGDYEIMSEVMQAHQRSYIGNKTIVEYMARDYKVPKDFRQFLYVSQVLQAEGIRMAMEGHRARMPYCMGSLFWQINDCWPVASWSSIDYFGRWKAQQYFARKSFAPVLVTSSLEGGQVTVQLVSERPRDQPANLTLEVTDFHGMVSKTIRQSLTLKANSSALAFGGVAADLLAGAPPESTFLHATLAAGGNVLAQDILYFRPVKELALPQTMVATRVKDLGGTFAIALSSPVLVKNLHLSLDETDGFFSDNYFDLLPGRSVIAQFKPAQPITAQALETNLKLMHMALVA